MADRIPLLELPTPDYHALSHPEVFRDLAARGPVTRVLVPGGIPVWVVTDPVAGRAALADPRLRKDALSFSGLAGGLGRRRCPEDITLSLGRALLNADGPVHTRLRGIIGPELSRAVLATRQAEAERIATELLATVRVRGAFDLVADFAAPLSARVLAAVLGLPAARVAHALAVGVHLIGPDHPDLPHMRAAFTEFQELLAEFGSTPAEGGLVSRLRELARAGTLTRREVFAFIGSLLLGSASPPVTLVATASALALTHRDLREAALAGRSTEVVEDTLRRHAPISFSSWRFAAEDIDLAGTPVARGDAVMVLLAEVNQALPSGHLSFGHGPHYCVGATLSRLLATAALDVLVRELPTARLRTGWDDIVWHGVLGDRRPVRIDVLVRPA